MSTNNINPLASERQIDRITYIKNQITYFQQLADNAYPHWRKTWETRVEGWQLALKLELQEMEESHD